MKNRFLPVPCALAILGTPSVVLALCADWCEITGRPMTVEPPLPECVKLDDRGASVCGCEVLVWVKNECDTPLHSVGFEWDRCVERTGETVPCTDVLDGGTTGPLFLKATTLGETKETFILRSESRDHAVTLGAHVETFEPGWTGCGLGNRRTGWTSTALGVLYLALFRLRRRENGFELRRQ